MILSIDQLSSDPIYQQIHDQVVAAVAKGELSVGDGLPSVRSLAADLGINLHTVNKAYALLRDEGYVVMKGRKGAFIADFAVSASSQQSESADSALQESLYQLACQYVARGGTPEGFVELARIQAARL
ncbi:MAG: GntR family transcriptional regulator [Eggerthellaceae bacterium]